MAQWSGILPACQGGDLGSIPGLGRGPGGGRGKPARSSLENPRDGGACGAAVLAVTKSWTRLSDWATAAHTKDKWVTVLGFQTVYQNLLRLEKLQWAFPSLEGNKICRIRDFCTLSASQAALRGGQTWQRPQKNRSTRWPLRQEGKRQHCHSEISNGHKFCKAYSYIRGISYQE